MNIAVPLYYYRNRYYSPTTARFISEDPIGWASGQTNAYAYVSGNPVQFRDPRGLTYMPGGGGWHTNPSTSDAALGGMCPTNGNGVPPPQPEIVAGIGADVFVCIMCWISPYNNNSPWRVEPSSTPMEDPTGGRTHPEDIPRTTVPILPPGKRVK
ncbi:RHS repeat-associated core domain-containing protein [Paraburkholderia sediminicola]|uniref:RHS repeat-associated core domain-containing protein n=1 Tax=Paraburkholderia sediminicola TaxID=458836 RepID=UPI0038BD8A8C